MLIGAWFAIRVDGEWFRIILSLVMVGVVLSLIFPLKQPDPHVLLTTQRRWLGNLGMVGIDFYGGFIQIGVGFLLIALLFHGFREELGEGNQAQGLRSHDLHNVFVDNTPVSQEVLRFAGDGWPEYQIA